MIKDNKVKFDLSLNDRILATFMFMMGTAARSNGSLLFIFPLCFSFNKLYHLRKSLTFKIIGKEVALLGFFGLLHALPIFCVLYYGYSIYCVEQPSPYCFGIFPNVYSYVQEKYWNVGLFKY